MELLQETPDKAREANVKIQKGERGTLIIPPLRTIDLLLYKRKVLIV